jgi:hypothetical protein
MITEQHPAEERLLDQIEKSALDEFPALNWYPQQAEWMRDPWCSDNVCFNYPLALRIDGPLDREALRLGFQEMVRRHQVFRSLFVIQGGEVVQRVLQPGAFSMAEINLEDEPEQEKQQHARYLAIEDAQTPFDPAREPLFRVTLLRLGVEEHVLLLTTHHSVCDDWSIEIFLAELARLYSAFVTNRSPFLPEVRYQYSDFVHAHLREMGREGWESHLEFWKTQLAGGNFHHLATDYFRPKARICNGKRMVVEFPAELDLALKGLSQSNGSSPFMTLIAGFLSLLAKYCGKADVGTGICVANRNAVEVESLIGPFSNRLLLRAEILDELSVPQMLERVRDAAWQAYSFQEIPFGEVVASMASAGHPGNVDLVQTMVVYENAPKQAWEFPGLRVGRFEFDTGMACYDLHIWLRNQSGLEIAIQYNADVFAAQTIQRIVDDYQKILEGMVANPDGKVKDLLPLVPIESEAALV